MLQIQSRFKKCARPTKRCQIQINFSFFKSELRSQELPKLMGRCKTEGTRAITKYLVRNPVKRLKITQFSKVGRENHTSQANNCLISYQYSKQLKLIKKQSKLYLHKHFQLLCCQKSGLIRTNKHKIMRLIW